MAGKRADAPKVKALKQQFATELNEAVLRAEKRHGRINRSRLATELSISTGSVYAYLNGTTLPSTALLDRLLITLKIDAADAKNLATLRDAADVAQRSDSAQGAAPSTDLPRDIALLHGRDDELERIRAALTEEPDTVVLCVLSGLGGVGKTALAVRTARTLWPQFPDGCLFVNLHGYSAGPVTAPEEAADKLLRQLDVPVESLPAQPDRRLARLRAELRDRRLLLVLDNALDAAHIEPLLPTDGRCAVLITSRSNLNGLDDAKRVRVPPLSPRESSDLLDELTAGLPPDRLPDTAARTAITALCGGLPVALRIAAAVLRSEPWPVATQPLGAGADLEVFHDGDRGIESLFDYSLARLSSAPTRTFALLGLHCGPTFDVDAAAVLAGADHAEIRRHLRRLVEANLLDAPSPGRYTFHDLLRAFAARRARNTLPPNVIREAGTRIVDHYLARLDAADRLLTPHRHRTGMTPATIEPAYRYADYHAAERGLAADRDNLAAAAHFAFDAGLDEQCWQIAFAVRGFVFLTTDVDLWIDTHELALAATRRAGNRHAEAVTRNNLGLALLTKGDDIGAARMYERARELFVEIGDAHGEHTTIAHQAWIHFTRGEFREALRASSTALAFVTESGTPRNTAILLRDTALIEVALGKCFDAVPRLLEALEMFRAFGLRLDEAMACNVLGAAYQRLGAFTQAREAFEQAVEVGHAAHSVLERARGHQGLADLAAAQQDWPTARVHWLQARTDYLLLNNTTAADAITTRLNELPAS